MTLKIDINKPLPRSLLPEINKTEKAKRLFAAWQLIADPKNHTKGSLARDQQGLPCYPRTERAVTFCALGAVERAQTDPAPLFKAAEELGYAGVVHTNDYVGHSAVRKLFRVAILIALGRA